MNQTISIITVVFNGEKYIEQTIKSVISQDYEHTEYIIIDGASTDNTLNIVEKYKDKISKIVSEKDNGLSDAMNKGARLASGDWILYLHADDVFIDSKVLGLLMSRANEDKNVCWVTGYLHFQGVDNRVFRKDEFYPITWNRMIIRNIIRHQATIVKKENLLNIGFNSMFKYAMDYDFFLRFWKRYGPPSIIKAHIAIFRIDGNNLSSNYYDSLKDEMKARTIFRKKYKVFYKIPFDYCVYLLRYLKIKFVHNVR